MLKIDYLDYGGVCTSIKCDGISKRPIFGITARIVRVYAKGDELQYIINNFANIPYNKDKSFYQWQSWRGDFADFIAKNL